MCCSQAAASESAYCPTCSQAQADSHLPALLLLRMSDVLYTGLRDPPQPHREPGAAPASTPGRILLRRLRDGPGGDRNGF